MTQQETDDMQDLLAETWVENGWHLKEKDTTGSTCDHYWILVKQVLGRSHSLKMDNSLIALFKLAYTSGGREACKQEVEDVLLTIEGSMVCAIWEATQDA